MSAIRRSALALALCAAAGCGGGGGDGEPAASPAPVSEVEPNDSCASANPLTMGATYVGTISSAEDVDFYAFDVASWDDRLNFVTFDHTGAACSGVDIELYGRTSRCETSFGVLSASGCPKIVMFAAPGRRYLEVARRPGATVGTPFGYTLVTWTGPDR
jgi:hypothetical protein